MWPLSFVSVWLDCVARSTARDGLWAVLNRRYGVGRWRVHYVHGIGECVFIGSDRPDDAPATLLRARQRACRLRDVLELPRDSSLGEMLTYSWW